MLLLLFLIFICLLIYKTFIKNNIHFPFKKIKDKNGNILKVYNSYIEGLYIVDIKDKYRKSNYIEQYLKDIFQYESIDGVLLKNNKSIQYYIEKYSKKVEIFDYYNGMVLLFEIGDFIQRTVEFNLVKQLFKVTSCFVDGNKDPIKFSLEKGIQVNKNSILISDFSIYSSIDDSLNAHPPIVIQIAYGQSLNSLIFKCKQFLLNNSIHLVIGIKIFKLNENKNNYYFDNNNNINNNNKSFKAISLIFKRVKGKVKCISLVSFGNCLFTDIDYKEFNQKVDSVKPIGYVKKNNNLPKSNNEFNSPPYVIDIPFNVIFNDNKKIPKLLSQFQNLYFYRIDLYYIKKDLENAFDTVQDK